ncbi:MAG: hypothetical protein EOL95_04570 [Bacteroidia bacterium]|nr:hypothetical protein [Bacteroidia bacterium]
MKKLLLLTTVSLFFILNINAQGYTDNGKLIKYRRSSIATMMVIHPEDEFSNDIKDAYLEIPTPDKFNDHNTGLKIIDANGFKNVKPKDKPGLYKAVYGKNLSEKEINKNGVAIEEFLNNINIGTNLIAIWYNLSLDSANMNMEIIKERGQYDASSMDVEKAKRTIRGIAAISDAGEELISKTFIIVNDMTYVTAEQKAKVAKTTMSILGGIGDAFLGGGTVSGVTDLAGAIADSFTGFRVRNHSYLFQLQWNDSIQAVFYDKYYTQISDSAKIRAFINDSSLFKVKYVAHEYEFDENSVLKGKYDRHDLIKINCARSQDKNIASLQLAYEDFKLKTPIFKNLGDDEKGKFIGYAAKVGLKEGITEKSKFQLIEQILDPETNKTYYKYVATMQPVKGKIWDNRYMATEEKEEGSELSYTIFKKKSGGEVREGMLLIEGKYEKAKK